MKLVLITIIAGILASFARIVLLEMISKFRSVHVDMIKAIGTLYHGRRGDVYLRGYGAHFLVGTVSAFVYLLLISIFNPDSIGASAAYGAVIGLFHGCVVSFAMTVIVDEHHPLPEFRTFGYEVVVYYWAAQIVYGAVVGAVIGARFL